MRGHAHITTVGVAPFCQGVLLWIFPLWVLPSASFSSSPFLVLLSRSRFYSYFFCFNGINKQQFSSVLTLKWKIYSAFIRFIPLSSQFPFTQISYNLFYFAISLRISLISRRRIRRLAPPSFFFFTTSCSLFRCDELGCSALFFPLTLSTLSWSRDFRVTTFGIVKLWMQKCKQKWF